MAGPKKCLLFGGSTVNPQPNKQKNTKKSVGGEGRRGLHEMASDNKMFTQQELALKGLGKPWNYRAGNPSPSSPSLTLSRLAPFRHIAG